MRRLLFKKSTLLAILTVGCCIFGFQIYLINQDANNKLAQTRSRLIEQNIVTFEKVRLTPHSQNFVQIIQNTQDTRDIVRYQDSYFAATSGGLLQLSQEGKLIKHFTVLDGLPESDLTSLAIFDAKLFIGTRTNGIVTFDGENFVQFRFTECDPQAITTFLNDNGRLLIGTFNGGLLEFDGKDFREIKAENQTIKAINYLTLIDATLYVGTFDNGLWIYKNDVWRKFTTVGGLPSNRIIGVVENGGNPLVATDFGLSVFENDKLRTIKILPMISSLESLEDKIYLSTENGEIFTFDKQLNEEKQIANVAKSRLTGLDRQLFLLTNNGIFRDFKPFTKTENNELADNFVTSIAFDKNDNLWAGTFRNGIDVFTAEGKMIKHIENDNTREINYLQIENDEIIAATSKGLWRFDNEFSHQNIAKGSITHFSNDAIATNKGLKLGEKLLTNANGLSSNSTYTTLQFGKKLYVGTLGGLAEIQQNKAVKTWTDANSKLTNNWITALCLANERIFIGTYGGGLLELLPSGELHQFSNEIGKFVVNPNAVFSDSDRVHVGTLNGVKVLNFQTNKWTTIRDILPSEAVFAINSDGRNLYFATTNGIAKVNKQYFDEVEKQ
jgi:ligand-binding sensor domain-containing protein